MASVASASPSRQDFLRANSTEDTDSWQHVETNSSPAGYIPSPASSFNGWGIIGYPNHLGTSPTIMSPLPPPTSHPNQQSTIDITAEDSGNRFLSLLDSQEFVASHEILFSNLLDSTMNTYQFPQDVQGDSMCDMSNFEGMDIQAQPADLDIPIQFQHDNNVAPWAPMNRPDTEFMFFDTEDVSAQMSRTPSYGSAGTNSHRSSPSMPSVKSRNTKDTDPIKKVRGSGRVEKKKSAPLDNFVIVTPTTINQQSGKPNIFECFEMAGGIQRGRKGPLANKAAKSARNIRRMGACFCCRSRKVKCDEERPCKNCKKISAQIPQVVCWQFSDFLPVLFPGFIRGHFKKEVMARFISDNVSKFYSPSSTSTEPWFIELSSGSCFGSTLTIPASLCTPKSAEVLHHWHVSTGVHRLDLHSCPAVPIGIDPKDSGQREALKRRTRLWIHNLVNEPRYAEQVTDSLRSTQLPRQVLTIVQRFAQRSQSAMVKSVLAIYVTHYMLTRQLCLTQNTVDRLLQLQQTQPQKLPFLSPNISAQTTARILSRQIKAVLDEYLLKETESLFAAFGSALKPRSRTEWASCLASFLVLCLLFESIEAATDTFAVSEAEVALRTRRRSTTLDTENKFSGFTVGGRKQALDVCREIDNLPFRQVAYRFHAVYQTHHVREPGIGLPATGTSASGGGGTGNVGPTFNPLVDSKLDVDLEPAGAEMAASLRALLDIDGSWHELDYLTADPILSQAEAHPYPRDITLDYTGRLLARFLLSFTDEKYLFDG
ncbi:hypothetical protein E0Z10_g3173 [Xylaria hypoxylon]|uniref:Zn(2)-C6 fungal-type domain-containing protein n=1 Tax=Xylaria hypoxylon TaxID=37992 RepID=A0A4Z0YNX2_9PEZI|nr:hypothetical protein E0Z10_g3173 [Xylaria hypoxylon]